MDSGWEGQAADILDAWSVVECFARNDHMGLVIQYGYLDVDHDYTPDFVVRLTNGLQVVLEIKGYMFDADDRVNEKNQGEEVGCRGKQSWRFRNVGLPDLPQGRAVASETGSWRSGRFWFH